MHIACYDARQCAPQVISADPDIWPRCEGLAMSSELVEHVLPRCSFWPDAGDLRSFIAHKRRSGCLYVRIDMTEAYLQRLQRTEEPLSSEHDFLLRQDAAKDSSQKWTVLGFDVADIWLTSFIHNCGQDWITPLNSHGLIDTVERAYAIAERANACIPQHSPFFPFRLSIERDDGVI